MKNRISTRRGKNQMQPDVSATKFITIKRISNMTETKDIILYIGERVFLEIFSWWRPKMKASESTASQETREEDEETVLRDEMESKTKQEGSQEVDCENNCLSGIKWPPGHQAKNQPKKRGIINGFRKIKTQTVTHGGRTSKLPARFMETDSENESVGSKKRVISRKDEHETSGERSNTCSSSKRKICKNGRTEPLENKAGTISKRRRKSKLYSEDDIDVEMLENGVLNVNSSYPSTNTGLATSETLSRSLKRNFCISHSETESSSDETLHRKRGRPPKTAVKIPNIARGKTSKSFVSISPHGDCVVSATNTSLTSPNLKPKKKKRKLLNGLRSASVLQGISSDDSSSECSSPKKRGRPPKTKHSSLSASEKKLHEFGSKNGVRKPWVRPVLKSLHKRALFRSHEEHLDSLLDSPDKNMTKVKAKLAKMNGFSVSRECTNAELVKRKRGRPPKVDSVKKSKLARDVFSFTDEEDLDTSSFNGRLKKLKKLKKLEKNKLGKRPLAASKVNKTEKLLADKLKKKAIKKAKQALAASYKDSNVGNESMDKDSAEALQCRRRQRNKIDRVLGMRLNSVGEYEYLVQWKDGTSCWTSSDQAADYELDLKSFLGHEYQEFCSINRLVFKAYFHDNLDKLHVPDTESEEYHTSDDESGHIGTHDDEEDDDDDIFSDADDIFDNCIEAVKEEQKPKKRGRKKQENVDKEFLCKEVTVQKLPDCVHITVRRSSGKQMRVNLRIIDSLTLALEEAAVDPAETVVISGLGDDMFCGVDLDTIVTIPLEGEVKNYRKDVDKIRYLIQTIQYFPKPVIATINKPAEGLGAQLVALCDMVCDKSALGDPVNLALAKANGTIPYCFPRLMGHATVSEHVLMGEPLSSPVTDWRDSLSEIFKTTRFTSELLTSVEAMTQLPPCLQGATGLGERIGNCSSEEEQRLTREVDQEKNKVQDSLKELMAFWENVTAKVS